MKKGSFNRLRELVLLWIGGFVVGFLGSLLILKGYKVIFL